jgi:hypothetical protein
MYWTVDSAGHPGSDVSLISSPSISLPGSLRAVGSSVHMNISYCGSSCYFSTITSPYTQISSSVVTNSSEFWIGFSNFFPTTWELQDDTLGKVFPDDRVDIFRIQYPGENTALLSIFVSNHRLMSNICIRSEPACISSPLGYVNQVDWTDWVLNIGLGQNGHINIWRNNVLMLTLDLSIEIKTSVGILPAMTLGVYHVSWKDGVPSSYEYADVVYTSLRVGDR